MSTFSHQSPDEQAPRACFGLGLSLAAALLLLALPACTLTPDQAREPTRVANTVAEGLLPAIRPGSKSTVFPAHVHYPSQRSLPGSVVQALPQRVRNLPQSGIMTVGGVVQALGLGAYRDRVTSNYRLNTYFVFLDSSHVLNLICDPMSLRVRVPSSTVSTRWDAVVTEVQLRQNPNVTVVSRQLPAPLR